MIKPDFYAFLALSGMLVFGCSNENDDSISLINIDEKKIPAQALHDVVLINQNDSYSCATTSLAMILSEYKGLHSNPFDKDETWKRSGSSISAIKTLGNDLEGLYRVCDAYGFKYEFLQHLKNEEAEYLLANGIFMVAFISLNEHQTHAIALTGYDRNIKAFYANDTNGRRLVLPYERFDKYWNAMLSRPRIRTVRSALVVFPDDIKLGKSKLRN